MARRKYTKTSQIWRERYSTAGNRLFESPWPWRFTYKGKQGQTLMRTFRTREGARTTRRYMEFKR